MEYPISQDTNFTDTLEIKPGRLNVRLKISGYPSVVLHQVDSLQCVATYCLVDEL